MTTLYHNPRCSKSRQALQVLQQANEPVEIVLYLKDPLSEDALKKNTSTIRSFCHRPCQKK